MATHSFQLTTDATLIPANNFSLSTNATIVGGKNFSLSTNALFVDHFTNVLILSCDAYVVSESPTGPPFQGSTGGLSPFACADLTVCDEISPPYVNLSSEAPDQPTFFGYYPGNPIGNPPLGTTWSAWSCLGWCESTVSQDDADQCARNNNLQCLYHPTPPTLPPTPPGPHPPGGGGGGYQLYPSAPYTARSNCPDGTFSYWTVPLGWAIDTSSARANRRARAYAQKQADQNKICIGDLPSSLRIGVPASIELNITCKNPPVTIQEVSPSFLPPQFPPVPVGDSTNLPTGMKIALTGPLLAEFSGEPDTPGNYTFAIMVTDSRGFYNVKVFTVNVTGSVVTPSISSGDISYFSGTFPAGDYKIAYISGAMTWQVGALQLSVNHPTQPFNRFDVVHSGGVHVAFPSAGGQFSSQAQVESANFGQNIVIHHTGGSIGVVCTDLNYGDNGCSGFYGCTTTPTFALSTSP